MIIRTNKKPMFTFRRHHSRRARVGVLVVSVILFTGALNASCSRNAWDESAVQKSYVRANRVISALERFSSDHGTYPAALTDLVPGYLDALEKPVAGNRVWIYWVSDDRHVFNLLFEGDTASEPTHSYSSERRSWFVDTK